MQPQKVQGHKLQHLAWVYHSTISSNLIDFFLFFWSKCPTWGHPDLGQPMTAMNGEIWQEKYQNCQAVSRLGPVPYFPVMSG